LVSHQPLAHIERIRAEKGGEGRIRAEKGGKARKSEEELYKKNTHLLQRHKQGN
jgi:hypothetical protein